MKKITALILAVLLLVPVLMCPAFAAAKKPLSTSAGIKALRGQFEAGQAPRSGLYSLDYRYYSPVGKSDKTKYPLVIFLHGIGHGEYEGSQLDDSDMAYWTSSELQSRFTDGGAFILLPRSPENLNIFWGDTLIEPLHVLIDDFIRKHSANIDTTRIAISGSSQGGAMVWMMLDAYPEYFATAFPIASTEMPTTDRIRATSETAFWLIASTKDPVVNYQLSTMPVWNKICSYNKHPENCRLSSFGTVYNPDGSRSSDNHHLAKVITYDLHTLNNDQYPEMTTINGKGNTVNMASPNGLIRWISSVHSDFSGVQESATAGTNIFGVFIDFIRNFFLEIVHIVQSILGL